MMRSVVSDGVLDVVRRGGGRRVGHTVSRRKLEVPTLLRGHLSYSNQRPLLLAQRREALT